MLATVVGVANKLEPDGSQVLEIVMPEGRTLEASIPAADLPRFLQTMQASLIHRTAEGEGTVYLPQWEVTELNLGHAGKTTELLVSTVGIGSFILLLSNDLLMSFKHKIEGALLHRSGPRSTN